MDYDSNKLTQFAAPINDERGSSYSLLQKLFKKDRGNQSKSSPNLAGLYVTTGTVNNSVRDSLSASTDSDSVYGSRESVKQSKFESKKEVRTFTNVLRRIKTILDKKSNLNEGLRPYKDSDFRQSWMPDSSCKECYDCGNKFTTFLRRHHCRICGQIFCSRCCNQEVPGSVIGFEGGLRACTYCCGVISDLLEGSNDLGTLRDNLQAKLIVSSQSSTDIKSLGTTQAQMTPRKPSLDDSFELRSNRFSTVFDIAPTLETVEDVTQEERKALVEDSMQLKLLFYDMLEPFGGIPLTSKRHRLRNYSDCFHGHELVTWLIDSDKVSDEPQAIVIAQALLDAKYVICLTESRKDPFHNDYTLYGLRELTIQEVKERQLSYKQTSLFPQTSDNEPNWVQELDLSALTEGLSFENSSLTIISNGSENLKTSSNMNLSIPSNFSNSQGDKTLLHNSHEVNGKEDINSEVVSMAVADNKVLDHSINETVVADRFKSYYQDHITRLCNQLLEKYQLPHSWADIILDLSKNVSHFVRPDVRLNKDSMDIGTYVHIKKVRSGLPSDSNVIYGVICTKSVLHRKMRTTIKNPTIMVLQSSIEYQRVDKKMSSLDPLILQEREYLQNCVARIRRYKPDILIVENTVSRVAQELLLEDGITVVSNVKQSVIARVARMTMAEIIPNIDSLLSAPKLGSCYKFENQIFKFSDGFYKNLMFFSGCPANLGCTIMLRGSSYEEICKVKPILMMMIYACYHSKLERAYMMDQMATLPVGRYSCDKKRPEISDDSSNEVVLNEEKQVTDIDDIVFSNEDFLLSANTNNTNSTSQGEKVTFSQILRKSILDFSPVTLAEEPYLESDKGKASLLRGFFPSNLYYSKLFSNSPNLPQTTFYPSNNEKFDNQMYAEKLRTYTADIRDAHNFINWSVNCSVDEKPFKDMIARYRASGARLVLKPYIFFQQGDGNPIMETEDNSKSPIDCFDIKHHQKLSILFSSYSDVPQNPISCVKPWIVHMDFYARNDMTLGQFLELYCFRESYKCPRAECDVPMINHIRKFVHGTGCLSLLMGKMQAKGQQMTVENNPLPSAPNDILTWSSCKRCVKATPVALLSPTAWNLSFAKFLQVRINCSLTGNQTIENCTHSLSRDYCQYFRFKDVLATFKYSPVTLMEVVFPPKNVLIKHTITEEEVVTHVTNIHKLGLSIYCTIMELLHDLEIKGLDGELKKPSLTQYKEDLETEKSWFINEINTIHTSMNPYPEHQIPDEGKDMLSHRQLHHLVDELVRLKCHLARSVHDWNTKFEKLSAKEEKALSTEKRTSKQMDIPSVKKPSKVIAVISGASSADQSGSSPRITALPASAIDPNGPVQSYDAGSLSGAPSVSSLEDKTNIIVDSDASNSPNHNSLSSAVIPNAANDKESLESFAVYDPAAEMYPSTADNDGSSPEHLLQTGPLNSTVLSINEQNSKTVAGQMPPKISISVTSGSKSPDHHVSQPKDYSLTNQSHSSKSSFNEWILSPSQLAVTSSPMTYLSSDSKLKPSSVYGPSFISSSVSPMFLENHFDSPTPSQSSIPPIKPVLFSTSDYDTENGYNDVSDEANSAQLKNKRPSETDNEELENVEVVARERQSARAQEERLDSEKVKHRSLKRFGSRYLLDSIKTAILQSSDDPLHVKSPFADDEHYLLMPTVANPVVIYDEEPSSIIAYCLASQKYEEGLIEVQKQLMINSTPKSGLSSSLSSAVLNESTEHEANFAYTTISSLTDSNKKPTSSTDPSRIDSNTPNYYKQLFYDLDFASYDDTDGSRFANKTGKDKSDQATVNQHIELQFTEKLPNGEKAALFYCKVFFAADFKKLRKSIFPEGEEQFIRSLSHCYKWHAKGGKSGLRFCKTTDERFVIKQMNRQEMQSFLEFGPHYFEYIRQSTEATHDVKKLSVLAKILGVYRIGFKNFITNAVSKQDVLVMENLFYNRRIAKTFDLKGSDRNRLSRRESMSDAVLLDENFTKYSKQNPIYMRSHCKKILMNALCNDSEFLSSHTVMDYSLLCGYDEDSKELIVGVIDYIRTFTWDKKLETVVKSSGILGGQGKMPTIVSPEVYRTRFLDAMDRYFNVVPDRWTGLSCDDDL